MRFGVFAWTFGAYDVPALVALARDAEASGWDGFFVADHLRFAPTGTEAIADTTVALTAIALATARIRFGPVVTPVARRRPWKLAKEAATLDRVSGGRLVLGVGLGGSADFLPVGEPDVGRQRAAVLDEGLAVLAALWSGEPVSHEGRHFVLRDAQLLPTPVQRPRVPIWVGGFWPNEPPFRRAARWDGALPLRRGALLEGLTPEETAECAALVRSHRPAGEPFELIAFNTEGARTPARVAAYAEAGATWWVEAAGVRESPAELRKRIGLPAAPV